MISRKNSLKVFLGSLFLILWFNKSINSYFSQDDFFHLSTIMDKKLSDIPSFFTSHSEGQTFYRPLSRETYNTVMYKLFALNPLPFHINNVVLILVNATLFTMILKKMTGKLLTIYLSVFIYLISSVHSIELYYLSSVQTLLSTSFALGSIYCYIFFLKGKQINYLLGSILLFSAALFSHESAIILPGFIFTLHFIFKRKVNFLSLIFNLSPFIILALIFFVSSQSISTLPSQKVYQPSFNLKSAANTLGWYGVWSLGLPEMLTDFVGPNLKLKSEFTIWYKDYARFVFPLVFFTFAILLLLAFFLRRSLIRSRLLFFSALAFIISLLPFLFFPQHKFVYYLSLASVWFSATIGIILSKAWRYSIAYKFLVIAVVLSLLSVSSKTTDLNALTHWAAKRAIAAKAMVGLLQSRAPLISKDTVIYFTDDSSYPDIGKEWGSSSKQAFYVLSGADALKLIYKNSSIRAYYEAQGGLPKNIDKTKVVTIMAKFPY